MWNNNTGSTGSIFLYYFQCFSEYFKEFYIENPIIAHCHVIVIRILGTFQKFDDIFTEICKKLYTFLPFILFTFYLDGKFLNFNFWI